MHVVERLGVGYAAKRGKVSGKFVVSLVEYDYHVCWNAGQKPINGGSVEHCAGRIVGVCDENQPRIFVNRTQYCLRIESVIPHRGFDQMRSRRLYCEPVDNERALAGYRVEPRLKQRLAQNAEKRGGPRGNQNLFGRKIVVSRQSSAQQTAVIVGI